MAAGRVRQALGGWVGAPLLDPCPAPAQPLLRPAPPCPMAHSRHPLPGPWPHLSVARRATVGASRPASTMRCVSVILMPGRYSRVRIEGELRGGGGWGGVGWDGEAKEGRRQMGGRREHRLPTTPECRPGCVAGQA